MTSEIRRVVLVVMDGVRPDVVGRLPMQSFLALARQGQRTLEARTVSPSVTSAAMTSLFTGVHPLVHGIGDGFAIPRAMGTLAPLPRLLAARRMPSAGFMHRVPFAWRLLAGRIARGAGFARTGFAEGNAEAIAAAAAPTLRAQRTGLIFLHLPDADRAGHRHGWMSDDYLAAAGAVDRALGRIAALAGVPDDPATLLVALADHGGGGTRADDHDSPHPLDTTIPILLAGAGVEPGVIHRSTSLLDVPPTILDALGVPVPASYAGESLLRIRRAAVRAA